MTPQELEQRLLYRDAMMLILNKPAGMPVHAGPGGGVNLEMYLDALRFGLPRMPALAHRLDRDTSGCLILGRHRQALRRLGGLFAAGKVEKTYWAVVHGAPPQAEGTVDLPLAKQTRDSRRWWMETRPPGDTAAQVARTDYRLMGSANGMSWLELYPRTGRTHQIRVHCLALGCPILGDPVYGTAGLGQAVASTATSPSGMHLHARAIRVPLYASKPPITAEAPPPPAMLAALVACGYVDKH